MSHRIGGSIELGLRIYLVEFSRIYPETAFGIEVEFPGNKEFRQKNGKQKYCTAWISRFLVRIDKFFLVLIGASRWQKAGD